MYRVIEIAEADYGCEGLPEGGVPMCEVLLEKDTGEKLSVSVADMELYQKGINEEDLVEYTNGTILKL